MKTAMNLAAEKKKSIQLMRYKQNCTQLQNSVHIDLFRKQNSLTSLRETRDDVLVKT